MTRQPHLPNGGVDLRGPRLTVTEWGIMPAAMIEVTTGQVGRFGGEFSLAVIDMAAGRGHIIPYDAQNLTRLRDNLNAVLEASTHGD